MIDPDKLNLTTPFLTCSEYKALPFFDQTYSRKSEQQSDTERTQKSAFSSHQSTNDNIQNPVFAHKIASIKSLQQNTEVFVIDR